MIFITNKMQKGKSIQTTKLKCEGPFLQIESYFESCVQITPFFKKKFQTNVNVSHVNIEKLFKFVI